MTTPAADQRQHQQWQRARSRPPCQPVCGRFPQEAPEGDDCGARSSPPPEPVPHLNAGAVWRLHYQAGRSKHCPATRVVAYSDTLINELKQADVHRSRLADVQLRGLALAVEGLLRSRPPALA